MKSSLTIKSVYKALHERNRNEIFKNQLRYDTLLISEYRKLWYLYASAVFGSYISHFYPNFAFQDCTLIYLLSVYRQSIRIVTLIQSSIKTK